MLKIALAPLVGLTIALAGCDRRDTADAGNDVEAAADRVAAETRDALNSPEMKEVGSELKEAAGDVGTVLKETARGAVDGAREGAAKAEGSDQPEVR